MKIIRQSVVLPAAAGELYAMYLSPRRHAAITGHPVKIGARPGARFKAFNGALSGRMLYTLPGRLIVQAWRSTAFRQGDIDRTPSVRKTGSHAVCDSTVPRIPGEAPMRPTARPLNTRAMSAGGRVSQSMAFLNAPGIELLYSGVTRSSASALATRSFSSVTLEGIPFASTSPS